MDVGNFAERIINYGFIRVIDKTELKKGRSDCGYRPNNGWMGLTTYHPNETFVKNDISIMFSLERFGSIDLITYQDGSRIEKQVNEKHIKIVVGDGLAYFNKYGVPPPKEIEDILK